MKNDVFVVIIFVFVVAVVLANIVDSRNNEQTHESQEECRATINSDKTDGR